MKANAVSASRRWAYVMSPNIRNYLVTNVEPQILFVFLKVRDMVDG